MLISLITIKNKIMMMYYASRALFKNNVNKTKTGTIFTIANENITTAL